MSDRSSLPTRWLSLLSELEKHGFKVERPGGRIFKYYAEFYECGEWTIQVALGQSWNPPADVEVHLFYDDEFVGDSRVNRYPVEHMDKAHECALSWLHELKGGCCPSKV